MNLLRILKRWCLCVCAVLASASLSAQPQRSSNAIGWVDLDGTINPGSADYLIRAIRVAEERGDQAIVIRLDTPGGLVDSTRDIVKAILAADIPVIVWVGPNGARAGSAGVFITLASHVAVMAPVTNIGAAHPVTMGGDEQTAEMNEKITNDTVAWAQALARERGRNVEWAAKAVRESDSIPSSQALKIGVIDLVAADQTALMQALDGRRVQLPSGQVTLTTGNARIEKIDRTAREAALNFLGDPNIAFLLLGIGPLLLLVELYTPGFGVPGIAGTIAIALGLLATRVVPVSAGAVALVLIGAALIAAELFVTSGLLAIAGVIAMGLGAFFLIDPSNPNFLVDRSLRLSWAAVVPTLAVAAGLASLVVWKVTKAKRAPVLTGALGLVGEEGVAASEVSANEGEVYVHGELWEARSPTPIHPGERVRVQAIRGLLVVVDRAAHI